MDKNGQKPSWKNWGLGEPNDHMQLQDHVAMDAENLWFDLFAREKVYVVCQQKLGERFYDDKALNDLRYEPAG